MTATVAAIAGKNVQQSLRLYMWKPLFSDRSDHSNHVETNYMETAQRSKSQ